MKVYLKFFLLVITIAFSISVLKSTPNPASKIRVIFIGANDTHYFCYLIKRSQPGSYYSYTDSTLLCKYEIATGNKVECFLLRITNFRDTTTYGNWKVTDELTDMSFNIIKYFIDNNIYYGYPSGFLHNDSFLIDNGKLSIANPKGTRITMFDSTELRKELKVDDLTDMRIITYYQVKKNLYMLIQQGDFCCIDVDFTQFILPLDSEEVKKKLNNR